MAGGRHAPVQRPPAPIPEARLYELGLCPMREVLSLFKGVMIVPSPGGMIRDIAAVVARHHGITVEELRGPRVFHRFVWARQELSWILYRKRGLSYPRIGAWLGQDHTTVLHGVRRHEARLAEIDLMRAAA